LEPNYPLGDELLIKSKQRNLAKNKPQATSSGIRSSNGVASEANNYDETTSSEDEFDYYDENHDDKENSDSFDSSDEGLSRNTSHFLNGRRRRKHSNISRNIQANKSSFLSGDVVWHKLPSNKDLISFFDCHLFEVCRISCLM
jgi:hypothetical protein